MLRKQSDILEKIEDITFWDKSQPIKILDDYITNNNDLQYNLYDYTGYYFSGVNERPWYKLLIALPGLSKDDITLTIKGKNLYIDYGYKPIQVDPSEENFRTLHKGIYVDYSRKVFTFKEKIKVKNVSHKNGILGININVVYDDDITIIPID